MALWGGWTAWPMQLGMANVSCLAVMPLVVCITVMQLAFEVHIWCKCDIIVKPSIAMCSGNFYYAIKDKIMKKPLKYYEELNLRELKNDTKKLIYIPKDLHDMINAKGLIMDEKPNTLIKDAILFYIDHNWGETIPSHATVRELITELRRDLKDNFKFDEAKEKLSTEKDIGGYDEIEDLLDEMELDETK